jgi:hypothetical protein
MEALSILTEDVRVCIPERIMIAELGAVVEE